MINLSRVINSVYDKSCKYLENRCKSSKYYDKLTYRRMAWIQAPRQSQDGTAVPSWLCLEAVINTCTKLTSAEYTIEMSWWWVEKMPETCRVFIHSVFCLTTDPKPPLKRFLHIVRSRASSFKWEYPLLSLRPSSSFLHLLPRLLITSISPFIFPSLTCFRRQFLL